MNDPLNRRVLAALAALPGDAPWDVIPGQFTAPEPVCGEYPTVIAADDALRAAGFAMMADFVPTPPLAGTHDLHTVLRYSAGGERNVVLVRRVGPAS